MSETHAPRVMPPGGGGGAGVLPASSAAAQPCDGVLSPRGRPAASLRGRHVSICPRQSQQTNSGMQSVPTRGSQAVGRMTMPLCGCSPRACAWSADPRPGGHAYQHVTWRDAGSPSKPGDSSVLARGGSGSARERASLPLADPSPAPWTGPRAQRSRKRPHCHLSPQPGPEPISPQSRKTLQG